MRAIAAGAPRKREADLFADESTGKRACACGGTCPNCRANVPEPFVAHGLASLAQPLSAEVRRSFEPRFGLEHGDIRLHIGAHATDSARGIGGLAFSYGRDIVIDNARVDPNTLRGRGILAHEVAHAVHHNNGSVHRVPGENGIDQFGAQFSAYTNAPSRELLCNRGIRQATILLSVRAVAEGTDSSLQRLLELVEFTW
jgi:hypothetical protein